MNRLVRFSAIVVLGAIGQATWCGQGSGAPQTNPAAPQKWAVLIGINDYAEMTRLKYSGRDVRALRERLLQAGFPDENITLLSDAEKRGDRQPLKASIERHMERVLQSAAPNDLVVVAFSGHGMEDSGVSYFCPIEARLSAPAATNVSLKYVEQRLGACKARQKLLLVDTCRNDPRPGGQRALTRATGGLEGFLRALEQPPEGILTLLSCKPGEISVEDDTLQHSVFMYFLLKGLEGDADQEGGNQNGRVSLLELYRYASQKTKAHVARARDMIQTPMLRGEVSGDFEITGVLLRRPKVQQAWQTVLSKAEPIVRQDVEDYLAFIEPGVRSAFRRMEGIRAHREQLRLPDTEEGVTISWEENWRRTRERMLRSRAQPQNLVLLHPEVIVCDRPETLLSLERVYAFAIMVDLQAAAEEADKAVRGEPQNPFAILLRALVYTMQDDFDKALADYRKLGLTLPVKRRMYLGDGEERIDEVVLRDGDQVVCKVDHFDPLEVTRIQGEWLWVEVSDKFREPISSPPDERNMGKQGWVLRKHVQGLTMNVYAQTELGKMMLSDRQTELVMRHTAARRTLEELLKDDRVYALLQDAGFRKRLHESSFESLSQDAQLMQDPRVRQLLQDPQMAERLRDPAVQMLLGTQASMLKVMIDSETFRRKRLNSK